MQDEICVAGYMHDSLMIAKAKVTTNDVLARRLIPASLFHSPTPLLAVNTTFTVCSLAFYDLTGSSPGFHKCSAQAKVIIAPGTVDLNLTVFPGSPSGSEYYGDCSAPGYSADDEPSPPATPDARQPGRSGTVPVFTAIRFTAGETVQGCGAGITESQSPWCDGCALV
jgi:hypothetical protein